MITRSMSKAMSSHEIIHPDHTNVVSRECAEADCACSMRSAQTTSSATVRARKAAAEAEYKRRLYEKYAEVEAAEYRAQLERIEAEGDDERRSRRSSSKMSWTKKWVQSSNNNLQDKMDNQPEVSQPGQSVPPPVTPLAAAPRLAAHLLDPAQTRITSQAPGLAAALRPPSPVGLEEQRREQRRHEPIIYNEFGSPILLQAIADTAAAAKALAAGQNKPRQPKIELSTYTGHASQWLQFKKLFDTTKPSYSPAENIARLQNALRGPAREAVASLLVSAEGPEEIMRALERSFACPEMIVLGEVQVLKSLPRLGAELKELGNIANKVRNSLSTMKLLNQREYLHSPELFHTVLGKLNPMIKMRWSDYASEISLINPLLPKLEVLSNFLTREHERHIKFASSPDLGFSFAAQQFHVSPPINKQFKRENILSVTHSKGKPNKIECVYCKKNHDVKLCKEFLVLPVDDRWRWLREHKVCYKCLRGNSHQWKSCKVNPCGVNSCSFRHHPLLHGRQDTLTSPQVPETQSFNNTVCATAAQNDVPSTSSCPFVDQNMMEEKVTVSNTGIQRVDSSSSARINTLLKVVPVIVSGPAGSYETFALLDDGSTATLIESTVATRVGLSGPEETITVNCVGGLKKSTKVSYVDFYIQGKYETGSHLVSRAKAIPNLNLRAQSLSKSTVQSYKHLSDLANVLPYVDASPTVLIGAEHWHLSITRESRTGDRNDPVACRTLLGWTLYGVASGKTKPIDFINHCHLFHEFQDERPEYENLELLVKEHYKLDSLGISKRETLHSKQDLRAIEILENTARRLQTGRYEVGLPWRDNIDHIPDSYPQALSRFLNLERRMLREPDFADAYQKFLSNMIDKGYAEECNPATYYGRVCNHISSTSTECHTKTDGQVYSIQIPSNKKAELHSSTSAHGSTQTIRWYLPHFGAYHPQKRKLRVVHDAAARNQGVSLNSLLLQGPDLLESLLGILFRFREGAIAMTADIKEMFPQIRIREHDRDALRFLWRDVKSKDTVPIKEYRMSAVIFGASSSPFTALYIKNKNAMTYQNLYPEAVSAIINDHYMDDYLGSHDDVNKAAQLASEIVAVHGKAGFEMRGWVSNNNDALRLLPPDLHAAQPSEVHLGSVSTSIRALGVLWDPLTDTIAFRTGLEGFLNNGLNKRKVLSHLMKVYDPLGLLGPVVVKGRILLQEAWRSNVGWDTPFPPSEVSRWNEWFKELSDVSSIKIARWYAKQNGEPLTRELHIFADASELAYACVAYWRFVYSDGSVRLALISSKARVAPLKPTSIPRLELQAALIASRLANTINESHRKKATRTFLWTDSRTVLSWLRSDARTFKPFVAHRIGEITESTNVHDWRWVPTDLNVADDATRLKPLHLNSNHRWFKGPSFLYNPSGDWPVEPAGQPMVQEERKQSFGLVAAHLVVTADITRFSDWLRLIRATARVLQAAAKFRSFLDRIGRSVPDTAVSDRRCATVSASTTLVPLSAELMIAAERHVLQSIQSDSFAEEIQCIARSQQIQNNSRLVKLSPVMGEDKLLRLAGRIKAVQDIDAGFRSPILLDGRHPVVRMLVQYFHRKAGHANNQMVINEIRQRYWILRLRNTVRTVASQCLFCRIRKAKPMNPMTGDLPQQRLAHHRRPFTYTGIDYFGPINVTVGRRKEKRYVALFTCMTSRAVHLELVHYLSADSAIMSLRRFIARRGTPETIFSDNGTCFVGANRLLKEFYRPVVEDFAANRGVKWSFIPAAAPFFGGCWERLVRCVKVALNATLHERAPKEEILMTLLLEAEAIVNSRPLSHVSVDNDDEETLTPFHFLIGSSSNQTLPETLDDRDLLRRADWKKALRLADHFWNRWVKEVLPTMQPRQINNREDNLKIGDLVVIVDENLPRGTWPRGRIAGVFPGKDGVVRVVDVATAGGLLRRPVKKLVRLVT